MQRNAAGELVAKPWDTLRLMGVLQRIALCFGVAALIVAPARGRWALPAVALLLGGYTAASFGFGVSDGVWSLQGWFGTAVDRAVLGAAHLYRGEGRPFDPEGLASTPPAIAQVLLGWWFGRRVADGRPLRLAGLGLAVLVLVLGLLAEQLGVPVNKKLWTPSYVLDTTGAATLLLAALMAAVDGREGAPWTWGWARLFEAFGRNPLFIFVLSGFVPRVLSLLPWPDGANVDGTPRWVTPLPWLYRHLFADIGSDPRLGLLLYAVAHLAVYALLAGWMDRRGVYLRV